MSYPPLIGSYYIEKKLGRGGFGDVLLGIDKRKKKKFALKASIVKETLFKEYRFLKELSGIEGIPKVYEYHKSEPYDYFELELLGRTLNYHNYDKILTLECVCAIGLEVIDILENTHKKDILHRDIKPTQLLLSSDETKIYLVDFGLSTYFKKNKIHKEFKTRCKCIGSISYASINNHMGFRQSRRDDLESLCYTLIYLAKGGLP